MRCRLGLVLGFAASCSGSLDAGLAPDPDAQDQASGDGSGSAVLDDPAWPDIGALPADFDFPPYLNLIDDHTVAVSWRTMSPTTGFVHYGTTDGYGTDVASATPTLLHHVTLGPLDPGAAYHYQVSIDGTSSTRPGVFVMPGRTTWRFLASGEYHAPSEVSGVAKFADEIRAFRPHVIVESGDMVDVGDDLTHWRAYLRTAAPWISNVLLLPAHSNHVNGTGGNANLKDLFVLPNNERWYTTRYGQVEVVTIDSYKSANADVTSVELPWIAEQAAAAHDGVDDPTFVIAAWHHPACSSQYASRSSDRAWVQANIVSAFKANGGVDLILAAHDKYYERSLITGGIVHVITNIGNISPEIPGNDHPDCTAQKTLRSTRSTALFEVVDRTISAQVIDENGTELDTFTIAK